MPAIAAVAGAISAAVSVSKVFAPSSPPPQQNEPSGSQQIPDLDSFNSLG
ncbi:MAG: hypothetical protein V4754_18975 [Pseudomonadota bacterium]